MTVQINQLGPDVWEHRFVTKARPTSVFDYIADFARHVEWERELVTVKPLNRSSSAGGAYLKTYDSRPRGFVGRIFARGIRVTCQLSTVERPKCVAWRQFRADDASGPSSFQKLKLEITSTDTGALIVLARQFSGMEGISADLVARFSSRWGEVFQNLPPDVRAAAGGTSGGRPGLFSSRDDVVWHLLDGHPSRGPGPSSLKRLQAILDRSGLDPSGLNSAR